MTDCPCGSKKRYEGCCGPYIENKALPPTPEALMRSRYTAYTKADMDYIQKTMKGKVLREFNPKDAMQWAISSQWQSLEIMNAPEPENDVGYVTFVAHFMADNEPQAHYEHSEFHKMDGRWYYVKEHPYHPTPSKPVTADKTGRNEPCPCGSGKKYKKCCFEAENV